VKIKKYVYHQYDSIHLRICYQKNKKELHKCVDKMKVFYYNN